MQVFQDAETHETSETDETHELHGVPVSNQDIADLVEMFNVRGYSVYRRILNAHQKQVVSDTMGSATETSKAQYDVAKGYHRLAAELITYPEIMQKALETIQTNEKLRKKD